MSEASDATIIMSCTTNSDYAVICSFFEHFGDKSGLLFPSFIDLQQMIENIEEVAYPLVELHVKLMRKLKKSVNFDRWEKAAVKFAQSYSEQDGFDIERLGYTKVDLSVKLRLLKNLLEAQFDGNIKFKNEINKVTSDELRMQPLGKDLLGRRYWHLLDDDCNLRVYREDLDDETWELVSSDKESMLKLIDHLNTGKEYTEEEETSPGTSEESNTNSQEAFVKSESEIKVPSDGPSEPKRVKTDSIPSATASIEEPFVSEEIESPVFLVQGQGNGADCDTGNPGEGHTQENCQSEMSDKIDDSTECADNVATVRSTAGVGQVPDALPPAFESSSNAEDLKKQNVLIEYKKTETEFEDEIVSESSEGKKNLSFVDKNDAQSTETQPKTDTRSSYDFGSLPSCVLSSSSTVPAELSEPSSTVLTDVPVVSSASNQSTTISEENVTSKDQPGSVPLKGTSSFSLVAAYSGDESTDSDSNSKLCIDTGITVDDDRITNALDDSLAETRCLKLDESQPEPNLTNPKSDYSEKSPEMVNIGVQIKSIQNKTAQIESPAQADKDPAIDIIPITSPVPEQKHEPSIPSPAAAASTTTTKETPDTFSIHSPNPPIRDANPEFITDHSQQKVTDVSVDVSSHLEPNAGECNSSICIHGAEETKGELEVINNVELEHEALHPSVSPSATSSTEPCDSEKEEVTAPVKESQVVNISVEKDASPCAVLKLNPVLQVKTNQTQDADSPTSQSKYQAGENVPNKLESSSVPMPEDTEGNSESQLVMALEKETELSPADGDTDKKYTESLPVPNNIQNSSAGSSTLLIIENAPSPKSSGNQTASLAQTPLNEHEKNMALKEEPKTSVSENAGDLIDPMKSTNLTQLTFDYDASAPPSIILPPKSKSAATASNTAKSRRGRKRTKGADDVDSGNEKDERQPVVLRQSSRIAKLREKEEEDRRKQEADRLLRLKEEHERREKRRNERDERMKKMEEKQQRRQLKTSFRDDDGTFEEDGESEEEDSSSDDQGRKKKSKKRQKRGKKKKDRPWDSSESSDKNSESEDDGLDELHAQEENEELVFKSDHEFSPESDLDDEADSAPVVKHARTARAGTTQKKRSRRSKSKKVKAEIVEEESEPEDEEEDSEVEEKDFNCQKCGQADHPEWILLCDRCDGGWHANCVRPALMVIPEGNWFCPPCDHATLVERLQERLEAYEFLRVEKEAELKRKKEQEIAAQVAKDEEEKRIRELEEEEQLEDDDEEEEGNSGIEDQMAETGGEEVEEEETSEESGEDEEEDDDEDGGEERHRSDSRRVKHHKISRNGTEDGIRKQRRAAKKANYSFKEYDDMIKSALRDEDEEEENVVESGKGSKGSGKGSDGIGGYGKGPRDGEDEDEEETPRSPRSNRPAGVGNKRISTSDDEDSDVVPRVIRKKKSRKLNDLSATSNEDDSDEDFDGSSADPSDSEEEDEEASDSSNSFVVDDDSDSDVVDVSVKRKARAASPTIRRSTRNSRKSYSKKRDSSDTSEEDESEFETVSSKRKRANDSWDSSGESSSDASWGRSKKRNSKGGGRSRPAPPPKAKPKPKPAARKAIANRGKGRGSRGAKAESDDEPFRSSVSVKKIKQAKPAETKEEGDSDQSGARRTTRGRQINYKELIDSSGESQDESNAVKGMGTLFAADRGLLPKGIRVGATAGSKIPPMTAKTTPVAVGGRNGGADPVPASVIPSRSTPVQDETSRGSGPVESLGDKSRARVSNVVPPVDANVEGLPIVLPQAVQESAPLVKEIATPNSNTPSALPPDLQVSRLINRSAEVASPNLPPDMQVNRLITSSQPLSNSSSSPARRLDSPGMMPQQRLVRDVLESQTPSPGAQLNLPAQISGSPSAPSPAPELPSYSSVIKQTRHSMPPIPPHYSTPIGHSVKPGELNMPPITSSSVIRPFATTAAPSLSMNPSGGNSLGNPLSIQGILAGQPSHPSPVPPSHARPYGNTSHMIGHGPFLNHPPYPSPYGVPVSQTHGLSSSGPGSSAVYMGTPVTPTPRPAYPSMYQPGHVPPHGLPIHSPFPPPTQQHHGPPLRPTSSYQHAGFPQAFASAAAAAVAANAEEERRIFRVTQANREATEASYEGVAPAGLVLKGVDELPPTGLPAESEFGGLVSYFSSQQEDFGDT